MRAIARTILPALLSVLPALLSVNLALAEAPSRVEPDRQASADTSDALPGIHRVGIAAMPGPHYGAAATASYGYTEPQANDGNADHRIAGSLAAGVSPFNFAEFGVRLDYRLDLHGRDEQGIDQSSSLDVTPLVRTGLDVGRDVHLGAEVRVPFLGAAAVDGVPSPTVDARFLASYLGLNSWQFAMHAGYKMGTNGEVIAQSDNLRAGDRVTLGLSEFGALLLGLGASKRISSSVILAEVTSEVLVGSGAPSFGESPFRLTAGLRQSLLPYLALSALVEVSPLSRAPSAPGDPLVPIEPRVTGMLGLMLRLPEKAPAPVVEKTPRPLPVPPPVEVVQPTASIRVVVVDHTGHPISDATVTLEYPETKELPGKTIAIPLLSTNLYVMDSLPPGKARLIIEAELLGGRSEVVELVKDKPTEVTITLSDQATHQSQLRGLVRSYSGEGIKASVSVGPGDHNATCNEQGEFELMLPPGDYQVTISADGFQTQKRSLRVQDEGVTVLNADLQKEP